MAASSQHPAPIIRPKRVLLRSGALGLALVMVALFGSLYLVSIPDGPWGVVLALQALTLLFATFLFFRYWASNIELEDHQLISRDFPYPAEQIAYRSVIRIVMAEVYVGATTDTYLCLYAMGTSRKPLLRMRTKYWEREDLLRVAAAIDAPITTLPQPVMAKELAAQLKSFWTAGP